MDKPEWWAAHIAIYTRVLWRAGILSGKGELAEREPDARARSAGGSADPLPAQSSADPTEPLTAQATPYRRSEPDARAGTGESQGTGEKTLDTENAQAYNGRQDG